MIELAQCTQVEAYKHLLELAEDIIYTLETDQRILIEFQQEKKLVLSKIIEDKPYHPRVLQAYKQTMKNIARIMCAFESQIENEMKRQYYNNVLIEVSRRTKQLMGQLREHEPYENKNRMLYRQQINQIDQMMNEYAVKFQNLGLTIEIHRKMHEIICRASSNEMQYTTKETQYRRIMKEMSKQIKQIRNIKQFMETHKLTQSKFIQIQTILKKLDSVLLNH